MIWRDEGPWGILPDGFPFFFSFCLRRVTFVNSDKSNQKRHSRGKGFRFPFPLENPPSLKRPKGRGCDPSPLETSPRGVAIIKSRLYREAAKVGGGLWPPLKYAFVLKCRSIRLYRG